MTIVVLKEKARKNDILKARKEHKDYIKITVDTNLELVAIGGEYHADAEDILLRDHGSKQKDIWGGGYNITTGEIETIAIINIRQNPENRSMEILDPKIRKEFMKLVNDKLANIRSLL